MYKLYIPFVFLVSFIICSFALQPVVAMGGNVVISQIQTGDSISVRNELIEIYNNSATDVEVTNWCLYYASALSQEHGNKLSCFVSDDENNHIYLPAYSISLAISSQLATANPNFGSDLKFSATLSGASGHVRLVDNSGTEIDKVAWGVEAVLPEGDASADVPTASEVLQRKSISPNTLQDTDINNDDFEISLPRATYMYGSIYEVQDICSNLDGIQTVLPDDYIIDVADNCNLLPTDVCSNLDGLQATIPDNMDLDDNNECVAHDECPNLPDIQTSVPNGFVKGADSNCTFVPLPLQITELLPNAIGSDDGNEFIELYNPNDDNIDLSNYVFYVGDDSERSYNFPTGSYIEAGQYQAFSNDDINFTLINTMGGIKLSGKDGTLIDETPIYSNPGSGMAWALIDGAWRYTNQPTSGSINMSSFVIENANKVVTSDVEPCATNQYRSAETGRCRLLVIASSDSILTPCKNGQYRSEETNRCRNIVSDIVTLVPCSERQERNPETNRCRLITAVLGLSDLAPCKAGQERNPETNRCRNVVSSIPEVGYAPEQTLQSSDNYIVMWSLTGVGVVAISYGIWEWRQEITRFYQKLGSFVHSTK